MDQKESYSIGNFVSNVRESGLKSALETDLIETLGRHPTVAKLATKLTLAASLVFSTPKPEPEVYVDHLEIDDGEYQLRRTGFVPVSVAQKMGWTSDNTDPRYDTDRNIYR